MISKWQVISRRDPRGGYISWVIEAANAERAIAEAHQRQVKSGAWGVVLIPVAVVSLHGGARDLAWGSLLGVPASFLPKP